MRTFCLVAALVAFGSVGARVAQGQTSWEFGFDAAYERASAADDRADSPVLSLFALPMQGVRVGFHLQDDISLEPRLGIARISAGSGTSETQIRASLAGLYFMGEAHTGKPRIFVSIVTGMDYAKADAGVADASAVQMRVGAGGGFLLPLRESLSLRSSAEFHRSFESRDALAVNHLIVAVGLSLFLL